MKFSFDKVLAAMGNIGAMERLHADDHTEAIINDIENTAFAISEQNVLYAGLNELGGYHYLQTVVVGTFHIKTMKGAQLKCIGNDFELLLPSDMEELESDFSNVSNRSITKIDFQIEAEDLDKINKTNIQTIILSSKKKGIEFKIFEGTNA